MNTKLLKKIRSRYQWYWHATNKQFVVIDLKDQKVKMHQKASHFIAHWVYDNMGFASHTSYCKRIMKREDKVQFNQEIKKLAA